MSDTPNAPSQDPSPDEDHPRVERERHVRAAPDTVWEVLADRDRRAHVLGGDLDVDLADGAHGTWFGPGEEPTAARVRYTEHARRLVFDWGDGDDAATVDIRLAPDGAGTTVRVVETRRAAVTSPTASARVAFCLAA